MSRSRVSGKSDLSPSITKGSNGIDLGKRDAVDMGRKSEPSITSGGIGVSQEVTNIGGMSVTGGVSVDISPVDFGVNVNPAENSVSVAGGAEIPGGLLGISGGVTIDTNTGEIIGGSIGGEIGGLGINISNSKKGGLGIEFTVQIPGTPIELSLELGFPPKEEPKPEEPKPIIENPIGNLPNNPFPPSVPPEIDPNCKYWVKQTRTTYQTWTRTPDGRPVLEPSNPSRTTTTPDSQANLAVTINPANLIIRQGNTIYYSTGGSNIFRRLSKESVLEMALLNHVYFVNTFYECFFPDLGSINRQERNYGRSILSYEASRPIYGEWQLISEAIYELKEVCIQPDAPPPFPNPPPRRRNKMDECCRLSIKLQRLIVRHLGAASSNNNQETLPDGIKAIGSIQEGIRQAYPFAVSKQWIEPNAKEGEKIFILNDRQLTLVVGGMLERLEKVLGTAEFYKDSDKKLRQSEGNLSSWLTGKNNDFKYPDPNDFWASTDDGIINEKTLDVRSVADGLRYLIESQNRLERILPIAELKDSSIPARWIYPNGKGQLRVGNLIHLCEYMIRKSDKDNGYWPQKITIKAANPAIEGDEPITTDIHSQADMLRTILQQIIDIEGDGDMGSNYDLRRTYLDTMAFQMIAKSTKYLQAITEYLSFDMTEEVSKIPIPFDPFAGQDRSIIEEWWVKLGFGEEKLNLPQKNTEAEIERLSENLLQNSVLEINTVKFGSLDERKEPKTLKESLQEILKHSSASAAAVTEVASEGALERVVEAASLAQKLTAFLLRRDVRESLGIGDFDKWINSAEKGYADDSGTESLRFPESDPFQPYGRPATENPIIREIDTKEPGAD